MHRREFLKIAGTAAAAIAGARFGAARGTERQPMPDVVVLLPGITGSVLRKEGRDLWALSGRGILAAITSLGRNLDALRLTADDEAVDDLQDGITADRLIDDLHLIPGFWKIDGYTAIARGIAQAYEIQPGRNYFEFPYDWRRSNRVSARRLARVSHGWLREWRRSSGNDRAKLIFLAHSMGGLVVRYFVECLEGWRDTRMLITFGTPYRGSLNAVNFLCNGLRKQLGTVELVDLTALLRSFTSVYQLLPIYPCIDLGDGNLVRPGEAQGIPNVDAARAAEALRFHREIEGCVERHLKEQDYLDARYSIHPVVGTHQPTLQSARAAGDGRVEVSNLIRGGEIDGDGTVPRPSATPIEMSGAGAELFIAQMHGSLQNDDQVAVQLSRMLSPNALRWDQFRASAELSLQMNDTYPAGEPISIRVREHAGQAPLSLRATAAEVGSRRQVAATSLAAGDDGVHTATLGPLPTGVYRLRVSGGDASVTDCFIVA